MNYPSYQHIPADPAIERPDVVWTAGYINPNQFADDMINAVEAFDRASIDNWMPIMNAEIAAQMVADKFGVPVTVTMRDVSWFEREDVVFTPKAVEV